MNTEKARALVEQAKTWNSFISNTLNVESPHLGWNIFQLNHAIPELLVALTTALDELEAAQQAVEAARLQDARIAELEEFVDHLQNWCASPEDEAAVRKEEALQCCLDICEWCRKDRPYLSPNTFAWHVPFTIGDSSSGPLQCRAYSIRQRLAGGGK